MVYFIPPLRGLSFAPVGRRRGKQGMSERLWGILTDSFTKILVPGLTMTLPLTAIAFFFAMILAVFMALVDRKSVV